MADPADKQRRRGATKLSELVARVLDPVTARRGFATADLVAAWPEIVGPRIAEGTRPQKIVWSRGDDTGTDGGVLHLAVDGPRAVLIQHEVDQIVERVNAFLGYAAVARVRLIQAPVAGPAETPAPRPLDPEGEARLSDAVAGVEDDGLRDALARLGRGVLAGR